MIAVQVRHYLGRARDFLKGMELMQDDLPDYKYSPALLGIHGAISYCDALRVGLGSMDLSSEDHQSASRELRKLIASRRYENRQGIDRLETLLGKKNNIAYAAHTAEEAEIKSVIQQSQRFALWAEKAGKELNIEGWGND